MSILKKNVAAGARSNAITLLDCGQASKVTQGVPFLLFSHDNVDFTNDIIAVLNKPGRAASSTAKATSSATPARAAKP